MLFKYLRLARFDHYIKIIFVTPGFIFSAQSSKNHLTQQDLKSLIFVICGACLISSANYTINEWLDRFFDSEHPTKSNRSAVKYQLDSKIVYLQYVVFSLSGIFLLTFSNKNEVVLGVFLLVSGYFYNVKPFRWKDHAVLDVCTESINNPIRVAMGWYAVDKALLFPISLFVTFFFLGMFLMSLKRYAELTMLGERAANYRKSLSRWTTNRLLQSTFIGALVSITFLTVYVIKWNRNLILIIPFIIESLSYYFRQSLFLNEESYSPEKLLRNKFLFFRIIFLVVFTFYLLHVHIYFVNLLLNGK